MNIDDIIDSGESESRDLDYKHPEADISDLVKELVAVANSGGGNVIVGVEESGGEIIDIHDVSNPSEKEEGIQSHLREKVEPSLSVSHNVDQYTGAEEEYHGRDLLILTTEPGNSLYSYEKTKSNIVFPYRLGSTTDYLTGNEVYRFYENNIRPGRSKDSTDADSESSANSLPEVASSFATALVDSQSNAGTDQQVEDSDTEGFQEPQLEQSDTPYYFSPAGGLETLTFGKLTYYHEPYGIEGDSIIIEKDRIQPLFGALKQYFGAELETGVFTISQRNAAWFGRGAGDFLRALDYEDRYTSVPNSFSIDKHHSEGTIFITKSQYGIIIIRSRRGINLDQEYLDEFSISFCTEGVPVDNRVMNAFLDGFDYEIGHARSVDVDPEQFRFGHRDIEVEPIELLESRFGNNNAGWAICQTPFYENPELLLDGKESPHTSLETLTTYEEIPCRIKDHHPITERHEYKLLRASVTPLTPIQGSVPHANAMVWINW